MDYIFWDHDKMPDEKPGIKFELLGKQIKQTNKMKKTKKGKKKTY